MQVSNEREVDYSLEAAGATSSCTIRGLVSREVRRSTRPAAVASRPVALSTAPLAAASAAGGGSSGSSMLYQVQHVACTVLSDEEALELLADGAMVLELSLRAARPSASPCTIGSESAALLQVLQLATRVAELEGAQTAGALGARGLGFIGG